MKFNKTISYPTLALGIIVKYTMIKSQNYVIVLHSFSIEILFF